jgi:hypothetical protein
MTMNAKAVYALYSNAVKTVADKAFDINDNEIELNMTNINNWVDPNAYVDKRVSEYPEDMLADKGDKSGAWFAAVKAVKDKYPKE